MSADYLDFAATTPVDPRVAELVLHLMVDEFGNAGSRTHAFGSRAAKVVEIAREHVARVVDVEPAGVIFTSGATEANNLAILGLVDEGLASGRTHIVSTAIEHKAVLEPLEVLAKRGFEIDLVKPGLSGAVAAEDVAAVVRDDTLLVSVMQVNNETGIRQPIETIAEFVGEREALLHVDAAQGFGKELAPLRHPRVDMVSVSAHKLYGPKGVGALILRRRRRRRPPLTPLQFGGGQERGLRPGTQPVPLIAGFGLASELTVAEHAARTRQMLVTRDAFIDAFEAIGAHFNGDLSLSAPHILNVSVPGVDSEAAMLALRDYAAISNGSACTSSTYEPSHVLRAMGVEPELARCALRLSWGPEPVQSPPTELAAVLKSLT